MPPKKKSSTPARKPSVKSATTKNSGKTTTTQKKRKATPKLKQKTLSPEEMHPFPTFPYRLEYQDGTDTRVCHFECEEHITKHIQRYKLKKGNYFIDTKND